MSVDIEKLEALAKAATPGPWWASKYGVIYGSVQPDDIFVGHISEDADIAYITAARNAVPELIARVRELEKERFLIIHAIAGKYGRSEAVELQKFLEESKAERTAKED